MSRTVLTIRKWAIGVTALLCCMTIVSQVIGVNSSATDTAKDRVTQSAAVRQYVGEIQDVRLKF
jgi:hypothetical protein